MGPLDPPALSRTQGHSLFQPGPRVHTDFTVKPDGQLPASGDEGASFVSFRNTSNVPNPPSISGGKLVGNMPAGAPLASYLDQTLPSKVNRIGAEFGFGAGDTTNGALCMAAWAAPQQLAAVQDAHMHFVITPSGWTFTIWQGGVNSANIASGSFGVTLPQDGTPLRAEVRIDGTTATILLPDNTMATATDSRIGSISGYIACWEYYRYQSTGADPVLYRTWADTRAAPLGVVSLTGAARIASAAVASGSAFNGMGLSVGEENLDRRMVNSNAVPLVSGAMKLSYFVARKTEPVNQLGTVGGGTIAAGVTTAIFALYEVAANGNLTLVAQTANDTTLFATANTRYTRATTATYQKTAGQRYALGLVIAASTMPTVMGTTVMGGANTLETSNVDPRLSGTNGSGLTAPPASLTNVMIGSTLSMPYGITLPA